MVDTRSDSLSAGLLIAQLDTVEQRQPLIEGVLRGDLDAHAVRDMVRDITSAGAAPFTVSPRSRGEGDDRTDHVTESPVSERSPSPPAMVNEARVVEPRRRPSAEAAQSRSARQSERSLAQATQTLHAMTAQLRTVVPLLQPRERGALLDFIVQSHFPELEGIIELLRD